MCRFLDMLFEVSDQSLGETLELRVNLGQVSIKSSHDFIVKGFVLSRIPENVTDELLEAFFRQVDQGIVQNEQGVQVEVLDGSQKC